jgi:hypothetical protein
MTMSYRHCSMCASPRGSRMADAMIEAHILTERTSASVLEVSAGAGSVWVYGSARSAA